MSLSEAGYLATKIHPVWEFVLIRLLHEASLSMGEDLNIRSSFYYLTHDRFQCEKKIETYYQHNKDRKKLNEEESMVQAIQMVEAVNSCDTIRTKELYEIDGYSYNTCVCNFQHPDMNYYLTLFYDYDKHGSLPFKGSLSEQPNYIMEVFNLIRILKLDKAEEDRQREEKRNK